MTDAEKIKESHLATANEVAALRDARAREFQKQAELAQKIADQEAAEHKADIEAAYRERKAAETGPFCRNCTFFQQSGDGFRCQFKHPIALQRTGGRPIWTTVEPIRRCSKFERITEVHGGRSCSTCRHWQFSGGDYLNDSAERTIPRACVIEPPAPGDGWPVMKPNAFCGAWQPIEKTKEK